MQPYIHPAPTEATIYCKQAKAKDEGKGKGKEEPTVNDWMKDTVIKDLRKNQPNIFNKVKGRLNPFWILLDKLCMYFEIPSSSEI